MIFKEDVEEFIEHYGKKGMRWGVRRAKIKKSLGLRTSGKTGYRRSNIEIGEIAGVTAVTTYFASKVLRRMGARPYVAAIGGGAAGVAGAKFAMKIIDRDASKKMSDIGG